MNKRLKTSFVAISLMGLGGCQSLLGPSNVSHAGPGAMSPKDREEVVGLALLIRGRSHLAAGNLAAAAELLRQAQRFPETKADATNGLGVVYARLKRFDVAARYFREAAALEPTNRRFAANLHRLEHTTRLAVQRRALPPSQRSDAHGAASRPHEGDVVRVAALDATKPQGDTVSNSPEAASSAAQPPAPAVTPVLASAEAANPTRALHENASRADTAANDGAFRSAGHEALQQARDELTEGNLAEAARLFRVAQRQADTLADASNGLGVVYARLGRPDLADRYMQMAAALEPANVKFAANIQRLHRNSAVRFARAQSQEGSRGEAPVAVAHVSGVSRQAATGPVRLRDLIPTPAFGHANRTEMDSDFGHVTVGAREGLLHDAAPPVTIQTASLDSASAIEGQCSEQGMPTSRSCVHVISAPGPAPTMEVINRSPSEDAEDREQADDATPVLVALADTKA